MAHLIMLVSRPFPPQSPTLPPLSLLQVDSKHDQAYLLTAGW